MNKSTKLYMWSHNIVAVLITLVSLVLLFSSYTPTGIQNAIVWAIIIGTTFRLSFDLKVMDFCIGTMFQTATIFLFDWWYIPFIAILGQLIYRFSCLVVSDGSRVGKRPFYREVYIVLDLALVGVIASFIRMFLIPGGYISLINDVIAVIVVCIMESAIGLMFIYTDLKLTDRISSISKSIAAHLREAYNVYIVYILMVVNLVIMYQDYAFVGLGVASSCIFALKTAFDKQAKVTKIEEESYTDVLTGAKNKKFYIEFLPDELSRSCAVFFIDFNGFKTINDTYGHDVGDAVIIHGSKILKQSLREKDEIIRFGGDEFMLLLYDANRDVCKDVIRRIEVLCEDQIYKNNDISIKISMSIGIAICPEESNNKDELVTIADEKMYLAKQNKLSKNIVFEM